MTNSPWLVDADNQLITATSSTDLQTCLHKLITTEFQNCLSSRQNTAPATATELFVELDNLIVRNNQMPRPSC
jgi:hypothetical protein